MSEFYKMFPQKWDRNTDNLTLEQEAAYLRLCNAMYAADQAIAENYRVLAGLWRCNERKAKRLLRELEQAGKVTVQDGWIGNEFVMNDVSKRRELRMERQSAGHRGGIESGKSRSKPLKNNETGEASASTRKEEKRREAEEKKEEPNGSSKKGSRIDPAWEPGEEEISYAEGKGLSLETINLEAERFRNYWLGRSGQAGVKLDWPATWRNWVLKCIEQRGESGLPPPGPRSSRYDAISRRMNDPAMIPPNVAGGRR